MIDLTELHRATRQHETRVETGSPPDAIARVADELSSCLVVMATHGRGPLSRLLVESVAAQTLQKLTVPVYLVRPRRSVEDVSAVARLERSRS